MKANKGEWSEIYAFLKILGEGKIYAADENLNKISNLFYVLIKILREENGEKLEYFSDSNIQVINTSGKVLISLPIKDFKEKALELLNIIKEKNGSSFSAPEIESFMKKIYCTKIKAPSSAKRDITIVVKDLEIGTEQELGFSIKSQLGNPSTLLNSSQSTNIVYEIENLNKKFISTINDLNPKKEKVKERLKKIEKLGGKFVFSKLKEPIFNKNLEIIDSSFPVILSTLVYNFFKGGNNKVTDLTKEIILENPLNISAKNKEKFYRVKIQHFLRNIALGMTPKHTWDTMNEVTGGFLVVKEDGEVLCYHIYNKNYFENYLFNDTKFDTPSTTRHKFASLYKENGRIYFNLNFQVRFIK